MRSFSPRLALSALVLTLVSSACRNQLDVSNAPLSRAPNEVPGSAEGLRRVIVSFRSDLVQPQSVQPLSVALADAYGFELSGNFTHALRGFSAELDEAFIEELANDPAVAFIEPDLWVTGTAQTVDFGIRRTRADQNATANINGSDQRVDVDVAVVDSGIDVGNADLNIVSAESYITGNSSPQDETGHGTHVAGTIGALDNDIGTVGIAPGARLHSFRVLGGNGSGSLADILTALDVVASRSDTIEVVNMSLGVQGKSNAFRDACKNLVARGVVVVVAAGNNSKDVFGDNGAFDGEPSAFDNYYSYSDDFIPSSYPEVLTVSALADSDGQPGGLGAALAVNGDADDSAASFSNFSARAHASPLVSSSGLAIDVSAPGVDIVSTAIGGGTMVMSGTSMASPHVAGGVALYVAQVGRPTNGGGVVAVRQAMIDSAQAGARAGDRDGNVEKCLDVGSAASPPADQPPADQPPADQPPADQPPADQPPADQPPADEPPADEPPVEQPPYEDPFQEDLCTGSCVTAFTYAFDGCPDNTSISGGECPDALLCCQ